MRRSPRFLMSLLALCALCALCGAGVTRAQGIEGVRPNRFEVEAFGGYSYFRSNVSTSGAQINLNGASGSVAVYVKDWLGVVGDLGIYHRSNLPQSGLRLAVSSYQFGVHTKLRNPTHVTPFAQVLVGVGHAGGTLYASSLGAGLVPLGANKGFLLTAGGGADWRLSPRFAIRLVQAEYLRSQFLNGSSNRQNNIRLSAGFVFNFGNN